MLVRDSVGDSVIAALLLGLSFSVGSAGADSRDTARKIWADLTAEYRAELSARKRTVELRFKFLGAHDDNATISRHGAVDRIRMNEASRAFASETQIAITLCHEIGHALGGQPSTKGIVFSYEGQADYFAFTKCLRRLWANDDNRKWVAEHATDPRSGPMCAQTFPDGSPAYWLCIRSLTAARELAEQYYHDVVAGGQKLPKVDFDAPAVPVENYFKKESYVEHPSPQCRLATMVAGALCGADPFQNFQEDFNQRDIGACPIGSLGARPRCWYYPVGGR